jgi:ABC-type oligopeptide transport system substrate-binding subunit
LISQKPEVEPIEVDSAVKEEYEKGEIDWTNLLIRKNPKGKGGCC